MDLPDRWPPDLTSRYPTIAVKLPGYSTDTDRLELDNGQYLFNRHVQLVRVTRPLTYQEPSGVNRVGKLRLVVPLTALTRPDEHEYLWTSATLLGQITVWHSLIRSVRMPASYDHCWQSIDGYTGNVTIVSELVQDSQAWQAYSRHSVERFMVGWQEALTERAATEQTATDSDSV